MLNTSATVILADLWSWYSVWCLLTASVSHWIVWRCIRMSLSLTCAAYKGTERRHQASLTIRLLISYESHLLTL